MKERKLRIVQVAKIAGVNVQTIRYYERLNLLPEPERRKSIWGPGYREYTLENVKRLLFIKEAKNLVLPCRKYGNYFL